MKIIPAIDIIGGKCVRLTQGNYGQCKIYSANPLEMARLFEEAGLDRLHLVDLDGAKASGVVNWAVLETICKHTRLSVDFGGGVKTDEDMRRVFEAGADYACIGSIAQTNPEQTAEWLGKVWVGKSNYRSRCLEYQGVYSGMEKGDRYDDFSID